MEPEGLEAAHHRDDLGAEEVEEGREGEVEELSGAEVAGSDQSRLATTEGARRPPGLGDRRGEEGRGKILPGGEDPVLLPLADGRWPYCP